MKGNVSDEHAADLGLSMMGPKSLIDDGIVKEA